ncbi:hydroxyisourate hydrolase [Ornithinimicrobium tianjinense]|uniref:5-hydroxyisourate hydrolase n=1 Tax=Ornithinimicrobium tianjinense TaxID=1195761 RepID=A0A917BQK3_9MICO|nr:hydroxyisourate hydrolase [Ornithinimicrobium tianjinense]GGF52323.1 5-hydroxyisourate hydrolase [Ornithinimicrobium tianjinense]
MATLSTHVLDTALGRPAEGVAVTLTSATGERLGEARTDADGRVRPLGPELHPGVYVLSFATGAYHAATGQESFYPSVGITFTVGDAAHYHVPLLLNPYGYSTYRGS